MQLLEVVSATVVFGLSATAALQISAQGAGAAAHDQERRLELDRLEAALALVQAQLGRPVSSPEGSCATAGQTLAASLAPVVAPTGIQLSSTVSSDGEALLVKAQGSRWERQRLFSGAALGWCLEADPQPASAPDGTSGSTAPGANLAAETTP